MSWTEQQQKAIDTRGCDLLVSAAAGSGKTAVLVERIIKMVTDASAPVDIDRLLVMTFTNAAAQEMRERVSTALEAKLEEDPQNANLERQATLINHAKITTIDSFCLSLIREHFQSLDIDPGFRVADEGELLLIRSDVMNELLEDYYSDGDPRFERFVDAYAQGKADEGIDGLVLKVWEFSQSNPWPGEWIKKCREELEDEESSEWMKFLVNDVRMTASEFAEQYREALGICAEEGGPECYRAVLMNELGSLEKLENAETYADIHEILRGFVFERLPQARGKNIIQEKKDSVQSIRNRVKDSIKKMAAKYAPAETDTIFSDMDACREPVEVLLMLAEDFGARYQEAKEKKNLVDFNDLEHFALEILTGGSPDHTPGPVADELAHFYREILVDEYQDSNEVQETLINCISRERFGEPDVFMVGDVKQSIYKFRLAKPELFLKKYDEYSGTDKGDHRKIELAMNFRSRSEVLDSVNDIFYGIMTRELGNIDYTDETALYNGADYPDTVTPGSAQTGLMLLDLSDDTLAGMDEDKADYTKKEAEARLIASKIKELTDPATGMRIWNRDKREYEPVRYRDIVILLRSMSGWAEEFLSVLESEGIPAFAESRTGYFTAVEVETVLNMLSVIDDPIQDIPLAAVLKSPIGGLSDTDLAVIAAKYKKAADRRGSGKGFCGAVQYFLESEKKDPSEEEIASRLAEFMDMLKTLRDEAEYLPVHRLILRIFELTGYYDYVCAMPAGKTRQANLDMLVEKASAYEETSYRSLFDFIRYIDKLKKYDTDFGEASRLGENDDTVKIMSIHKSKGLEFPVVFLAGTGKNFNKQDSRGKVLIDQEFGIATDYIDTERKTRTTTLKKNVVARKAELESLGEELRVLYVAMTRAKEKLIITAADRKLASRIEKWSGIPEGKVAFTYLESAGSYLDWILMASANAKDSIRMERTPVSSLVETEMENQQSKLELGARLRLARKKAAEKQFPDGDWDKPYKYAADVTLHAKMSVSEIKEQGQFIDDDESDFLPALSQSAHRNIQQDEENGKSQQEYAPEGIYTGQTEDAGRVSFAGEKKYAGYGASSGAVRGTAYHRALELLDFTRTSSSEQIDEGLADIAKQGLMDQTSLGLIYKPVLYKFFESDIAERMRRAAEDGKLYRERQFVIGIPAREMDEADSDEPVLIQGIIDAWFEEGDEAVIVDYKTDRAEKGDEDRLLARYRLQLIYYARALSQITGKKVKEAVIYSLSLQKEIKVEI